MGEKLKTLVDWEETFALVLVCFRLGTSRRLGGEKAGLIFSLLCDAKLQAPRQGVAERGVAQGAELVGFGA
jgi:hypothetical protein